MAYSVYLKKNEEKRLLAGHSWVYANEVQRVEGKDKNGALAAVYAADGRYIGSGYINHASKILVRLFLRHPVEDEKQFYLTRLKECAEYRRKLGHAYDNCCRLVFAEADGLPGLIVDKYGEYLVMQCLSLGIRQRKELIAQCLFELFSSKGIYERSDAAVRAKEGLPPEKGVLLGEVPDEIIVEENGLKMSVDVKNGQKTGYFLDQKENRRAIRPYCADGEVLDCFCNSGGFSLNAAMTAKSVIAADISPAALENVQRNCRLNGIENVTVRCGDVFGLLREYKKENRRFDAVILDPPAFCKSASEVKDAFRGYKDINILGMKLVRPGGFLVSCSCSHYMTATLFEKMLAEAAVQSGRRARAVEIRSQAPDHPALLGEEETRYLKFFVLQIL